MRPERARAVGAGERAAHTVSGTWKRRRGPCWSMKTAGGPGRRGVQAGDEQEREGHLGDVEAEDVDDVGGQQCTQASGRPPRVGQRRGEPVQPPGVDPDRPGERRRDEVGHAGPGREAAQRARPAGQRDGRDQRTEPEPGVPERASRRQRRSRARPWATVATTAACAAGNAWLPMPRNSDASANIHRCRVARRRGQQQRRPDHAHRHRRRHGSAAGAAVQPAAEGGHGGQPGDDAGGHRGAGGRRRQPQDLDAVDQQERPQQSGADRVDRQRGGVARPADARTSSLAVGRDAASAVGVMTLVLMRPRSAPRRRGRGHAS